MKDNDNNKIYYTYILKCENDILYTGITTDYNRRLEEHKKTDGKKGAKFTKSHKPLKIVALWKTDTRSNASKLEARIKQLTKDEKLLLIEKSNMFKIFFSELIDCQSFKRVRVSKKS